MWTFGSLFSGIGGLAKPNKQLCLPRFGKLWWNWDQL